MSPITLPDVANRFLNTIWMDGARTGAIAGLLAGLLIGYLLWRRNGS